MQATTGNTINRINSVTGLYKQEGAAAAMAWLEPLIAGITKELAAHGYSPWESSHWDEHDGAALIPQWREEIKEWMGSNFEGPLPGETVLRRYLDERITGGWRPSPLDDDASVGNVTYEGVPLSELMEHLLDELPEELWDSFTDAINDGVREIWLDEAVAAGIPSHVRAEFWWVPGWSGESLDDTEHLHIKGRSWNSTYIENVLPSEGLRNLLEWVNVSSDEFIACALTSRPDEGEVLKDRLNEAGFHVAKDPSRPSLVDPSGLIDIIENAGYTHCLPTAHAHVEVGALLKMDPRLPIALPLPKGKAHIGLHDTINGAGYMDTYPGTVVIPPLSLGFGWADRGSYGIDKTYGIHRPAFYCRPENVQPPKLAAGPEDALTAVDGQPGSGTGESLKENIADAGRLADLMKAGAGSVAVQTQVVPAANLEPVKRPRFGR